MQEEWRDIKGYEGKYQVSNFGRVLSIGRVIIRSNSTNLSIKEKYIRIYVGKKGYCTAPLSKDNKCKHCKLHRLIAEAFIPNPLNLPQVNHINGIKTDNRIENLEWVNNSENQLHCWVGRRSSKYAGVSFVKTLKKATSKRWRAFYTDGNGKYVHIGNYLTEEDARHAHLEYVNKFGILNKYR